MIVASNFLVPGPTFIVEVLAFLTVLFLLARFILPPLNKAMTERQETIKSSLDSAEEAKQRAAEAEAEYQRTMERAREDSRAMIDEANKQGEQTRADARARAEEESQRIVARSTAEIEAAGRRAAEELRQHTADTVIAVVEKVIGEIMDVGHHRQLIERTIAEVEHNSRSASSTAEASR